MLSFLLSNLLSIIWQNRGSDHMYHSGPVVWNTCEHKVTGFFLVTIIDIITHNLATSVNVLQWGWTHRKRTGSRWDCGEKETECSNSPWKQNGTKLDGLKLNHHKLSQLLIQLCLLLPPNSGLLQLPETLRPSLAYSGNYFLRCFTVSFLMCLEKKGNAFSGNSCLFQRHIDLLHLTKN